MSDFISTSVTIMLSRGELVRGIVGIYMYCAIFVKGIVDIYMYCATLILFSYYSIC